MMRSFQVLGQTQDHRHRVLVAAAKNIKNWFIKVRKIKAIYHTLNLFNLDVTQKCLIAECWVPVLDIETIQLALRRGTVKKTLNKHYFITFLRYSSDFWTKNEKSMSFLLSPGTQREFCSSYSEPDGDV